MAAAAGWSVATAMDADCILVNLEPYHHVLILLAALLANICMFAFASKNYTAQYACNACWASICFWCIQASSFMIPAAACALRNDLMCPKKSRPL